MGRGWGKGRKDAAVLLDSAFLFRENLKLLFIQICLAHLSTGESEKFDKINVKTEPN